MTAISKGEHQKPAKCARGIIFPTDQTPVGNEKKTSRGAIRALPEREKENLITHPPEKGRKSSDHPARRKKRKPRLKGVVKTEGTGKGGPEASSLQYCWGEFPS